MYMAARNLLKIKRALQEIWVAATKIAAEAAFDAFVQGYKLKDRRAECLAKDHDALLVFYDFPAEHWKHLRTHEPDRKHVRDHPPADHSFQGLPLQRDRTRNGPQARRDSATCLTPPLDCRRQGHHGGHTATSSRP